MINRRQILPSTASLISNLVSPPVIAIVFGFVVAPQEQDRFSGMLGAAVHSFLMGLAPLALVVFLYKTGRIVDLHMSNAPEQRRIPYLVALLCALITFLLFFTWGEAPLLTALAACNVLVMGALAVINNYWLVSNHTASIGLAAMFSAFVFGQISLLYSLPLIALVGWARWIQRKHSLSQLAAGILVGAAPVFLFAGLGWFNI